MAVPITSLLFFFGYTTLASALPSDLEQVLKAEREELAHKWAPLVWLHSQEQFYPSSVLEFLRYVRPSKHNPGPYLAVNDGEQEILLPSLSRGQQSRDTYLMASFRKGCRSCRLPKFLYGRRPGREYVPPAYGVIHSCSFRRQQRKYYSNPQGNQKEFSIEKRIHETVNFVGDNQETRPPKPSKSTTRTPFTTIFNTPTFSITNTQHMHNTTTQNPFTETSAYSQAPHFPHSTGHNININQQVDKQGNNDRYFFGTKMLTTKEPTRRQTNSWYPHSSRVTTNSPMTVTYPYEKTKTPTLKATSDPLESSKAMLSNDTHKLHRRNVNYKSYQEFSVTYWTFYPFNNGKDLCTTNLGFLGRMLRPKVGGRCHGETVTVGDHVGDWEHITIQFKGQTPTYLYVSSHHFGAFYEYNPTVHAFTYVSQDTREGFPLSPIYPRSLNLQNNHPIVYSALGSHGLWPTAGTHEYNSLPVLVDKTDKGTSWQTWKNLELIDFNYKYEFDAFQRHWLSFEGRWGNPKFNCHAMLAGFCELNHGPTGIPRKRINFPCQR